MRITFDLPHVYPFYSSREEAEFVRDQVELCVKRIRQGSAKSLRNPKVSHGPGKTQVTFDLPDRFHAGSNPRDNAITIQALMHCLIAINCKYLSLRPWTPKLYDSGVIYDRTAVWDTIPALYRRTSRRNPNPHGDCKSLAGARVAELKMSGIKADAAFRFMPHFMESDRQTKYHILIATPIVPNGYEDPSKVLGMGRNENAYFHRKTG